MKEDGEADRALLPEINTYAAEQPILSKRKIKFVFIDMMHAEASIMLDGKNCPHKSDDRLCDRIRDDEGFFDALQKVERNSGLGQVM